MNGILEDKALPSRCCDWIIEIRSRQDVDCIVWYCDTV
jgi:hypothetical protein